jgi:hypothetical protein
MLPGRQSTPFPVTCLVVELPARAPRAKGADVPSSDDDFQDFYLASYGRTVAMVAAILG